ncbi:MAG: DUF1846 family protein [Bacilli bacterium]|nr:DUF1846 family protein [Bacilli bacterium]
MKNISFDNEKYLNIQKKAILERIKKFNKLYIEFGGKLFDDLHASRVLPGFQPDIKLKLLLNLKKDIGIAIVVNSDDIISGKARNDTGITYCDEVKRLIKCFQNVQLEILGIVFNFYKPNLVIDNFIGFLKKNKIKTFKNYKIDNYPENVSFIVSKNGFGKNDYIKTTRSIIVVTAPGPGSGKMAFCLSQLYNDNQNNIKAGYVKYETFPTWNLSLTHPVNLAYEAATVDLNDINLIDPYHLKAYGQIAINYNRDIESFPILQMIFKKIYGSSPYKSPTDMGINKVGFAIADDNAVRQAGNDEIIRRFFKTLKKNFLGKCPDSEVEKAKNILFKANLNIFDRHCVKVCLKKEKEVNKACIALEKNKNEFIFGKQSPIMTASASLLINVLKSFAELDEKLLFLSPEILSPINNLKIKILKNNEAQINIKELLIILALLSKTNKNVQKLLKQINKLNGLQAHSSVIISDDELNIFQKLGIDITEEIKYAEKNFNFN